ncbi:D-galactarate dehydratase [uncultured Clostridium sp.]|uniref:UxaA family hydrolase n=1 Tax=Flintibacter sp. HCN-6482 TaxID=3134672 RepID=UPI0008218A75|nr:D-galactarate dehydratase [uncultured Clostridium sp.]
MSNMKEKSPIIRMDEHDNVAVARVPIKQGTILPEWNIVIQSDIPLGHKVAICTIAKGAPVFKYNTMIGYAAYDVVPGTHMHNKEIKFDAVNQSVDFCADYHPVKLLPPEQRRTFWGFLRENGKVGTRNYIAIPVVSNCAATVARRIAAYFTSEILKDYPNVDGVVPLVTTLGCGMEKGNALAMTYLRRVIAGHIRNPNMAGALVCALGCENNNIDSFFEMEKLEEGPMLHKLTIQDMGAPEAVKRGIEIVKQMLPIANAFQRQEVSIENLSIGLQCGGSDAFSCASANPALGKAMDIIVENGGTACLSETTELFSAEGVLIRRAKSKETGEKLLAALQWWVEYCKGKDMQINGKVTPGNNAGGLTNILEKAMGSVKKGGNTPLNAVYGYAEEIKERGLVIMDAPSYDPVSATAQFAGGCNLCVFTTGRGSCYGSQYFPTIKIASNSQLFNRMPEDMDINAGAIIDGDCTLEEVGKKIFEKIIAVASGEKTKSEGFGMGNDEYIPWGIGATG